MRAWTVLLIAFCLSAAGKARAQSTVDGVVYWPHQQFQVPFNIPPGGDSVLESIELYSSTNQGESWESVATARPTDKRFPVFNAKSEGLHWFSVRTLHRNGAAHPAERSQLKPMIRVVVDVTAPVVTLQALQPRNGEVGVSWDVRDTNFSLTAANALRLEYRPANSTGAWTPLIIPPGIDRLYWAANYAGTLEVKLTARDLAGNPGVAITTLVAPSLFQNSNPGSATGAFGTNNTGNNGGFLPKSIGDLPGAPPLSERHFVNSSRIVLNYNLEEVGRSGVKKLQLWYTTDLGRTWETMPETPYDPGNNRLSFNVPKEGLYGITIIAKSGADRGDNPPQPGEKPQKWIDVDLTVPTVKLDRVNVHTGPEKGKVTIFWAAKDNKQLANNPIRLYYSPRLADPADRKWTPILAERLPNTGSYTWTLPRDDSVPYEFYLKVEALDLAGNVGEDDRREVVNVDLSIPRARITVVAPDKDAPNP
jgi:hypothetical protein